MGSCLKFSNGVLEEKTSVSSVQISVNKNLEHEKGIELSYLNGLTYNKIGKES